MIQKSRKSKRIIPQPPLSPPHILFCLFIFICFRANMNKCECTYLHPFPCHWKHGRLHSQADWGCHSKTAQPERLNNRDPESQSVLDTGSPGAGMAQWYLPAQKGWRSRAWSSLGMRNQYTGCYKRQIDDFYSLSSSLHSTSCTCLAPNSPLFKKTDTLVHGMPSF